MAELMQMHGGACKQAGHTTETKADKKIRREKTVELKEGDGLHHPMGGGGLPLNLGEAQYLTLRDLSSHDQDREEGKVGREEAAVPKGPLPI